MTNFDDPVLDALSKIAERSHSACPARTATVTAALVGYAPRSEDNRHLLNEPCEACEAVLLATWARTPPRQSVLDQAAQWPVGGAMHRALKAHVATCDHPACQAFANALATTPRGLSEARWRIVAPRLPAALGEALRWSFPDRRALRSAPSGAGRPRSFLGSDVIVEAARDDPARTQVTISERAFVVGALLLILQGHDGEVLIEHVFADASESPREFSVAPERVTDDSVAAFLTPVEHRRPG
jgi:hypothetical protein